MFPTLKCKRPSLLKRLICACVSFIFLFTTLLSGVPVYAQNVLSLPLPGVMVSASAGYVPPVLKGVKIYTDNPFLFDFYVDVGDMRPSGEELREVSAKLIKYFLASLTVPEEDLWVNLSPYEKDRIIPTAFGITEMGRDMLAQDYILKQLTASLIYPEDDFGKEFWDRVYKKAYEVYGTTEVPVNTFNKVWIVPKKAVVYENGDTAFVVKSELKAMLEEDYIAMSNQGGELRVISDENNATLDTQHSALTSNIIREIVIPMIEKEINEGENFAQLRQVFHSLILATWFKRNLQQSILAKVYVDRNKVVGIDLDDKEVKQKIYDQYLEAYKQGVYDFIKEDYDPYTQQIIPRKYFSGGLSIAITDEVYESTDQASLAQESLVGPVQKITAGLKRASEAQSQDEADEAALEPLEKTAEQRDQELAAFKEEVFDDLSAPQEDADPAQLTKVDPKTVVFTYAGDRSPGALTVGAKKKNLPYIGQGGLAQVFDNGKTVIKVMKRQYEEPIEENYKKRQKLFKKLADEGIIPRMVGFGFTEGSKTKGYFFQEILKIFNNDGDAGKSVDEETASALTGAEIKQITGLIKFAVENDYNIDDIFRPGQFVIGKTSENPKKKAYLADYDTVEALTSQSEDSIYSTAEMYMQRFLQAQENSPQMWKTPLGKSVGEMLMSLIEDGEDLYGWQLVEDDAFDEDRASLSSTDPKKSLLITDVQDAEVKYQYVYLGEITLREDARVLAGTDKKYVYAREALSKGKIPGQQQYEMRIHFSNEPLSENDLDFVEGWEERSATGEIKLIKSLDGWSILNFYPVGNEGTEIHQLHSGSGVAAVVVDYLTRAVNLQNISLANVGTKFWGPIRNYIEHGNNWPLSIASGADEDIGPWKDINDLQTRESFFDVKNVGGVYIRRGIGLERAVVKLKALGGSRYQVQESRDESLVMLNGQTLEILDEITINFPQGDVYKNGTLAGSIVSIDGAVFIHSKSAEQLTTDRAQLYGIDVDDYKQRFQASLEDMKLKGKADWRRLVVANTIDLVQDIDINVKHEEMRDIGQFLRAVAEINDYENPNNFIIPFLTEKVYFTWAEFESAFNRAWAFVSAGSMQEQIDFLFVLGVFTAQHTRAITPHDFIDEQGFADALILKKIIRLFIPRILAWSGKDELPQTADDYQGPPLSFTNGDLALWALKVMLDVRMHDVERIDKKNRGSNYKKANKFWEKKGIRPVAGVILEMLTDLQQVDVSGVETGEVIPSREVEDLLARMFARTDGELQSLGFQSAFYGGFAYSSWEKIKGVLTYQGPKLKNSNLNVAILTTGKEKINDGFQEGYEQKGLADSFRAEMLQREVFLQWPEFKKAFPTLAEKMMQSREADKVQSPVARVNSIEPVLIMPQLLGEDQIELEEIDKASLSPLANITRSVLLVAGMAILSEDVKGAVVPLESDPQVETIQMQDAGLVPVTQDPKETVTVKTDPQEIKARQMLSLYLSDVLDGQIAVPGHADISRWQNMLKERKNTGRTIPAYVDAFLNDQDLFERAIHLYFEVFFEAQKETGVDAINFVGNLQKMKEKIDSKDWVSNTWVFETSETKQYRRFFQGVWSQFIIALANQTPDLPTLRKELLVESEKINPKMAEAVRAIVESSLDISNDEKAKAVIERWKKINIELLIDKGFYATLNAVKDSASGHQFFTAVIYKIDRKEVEKVNGQDIFIIYGSKIDRTNIGGAEGHSIKGENVIFISSEDVAKQVVKIKTTLAGEHYSINGYRRTHDDPVIDKWVRDFYAGKTDDQIRVLVEQSTKAHELSHKRQELLGIRYKLDDRFGIPESFWGNLSQEEKDSIESEAMAYMAEMAVGGNPQALILHLQGNYLSRMATAHHFAAKYVLNTLAGNSVNKWIDARDTARVMDLFAQLSAMDDLEKRAKDIFKKAYGDLKLLGIEEEKDRAALYAGEYEELFDRLEALSARKNLTIEFFDLVDRLMGVDDAKVRRSLQAYLVNRVTHISAKIGEVFEQLNSLGFRDPALEDIAFSMLPKASDLDAQIDSRGTIVSAVDLEAIRDSAEVLFGNLVYSWRTGFADESVKSSRDAQKIAGDIQQYSAELILVSTYLNKLVFKQPASMRETVNANRVLARLSSKYMTYFDGSIEEDFDSDIPSLVGLKHKDMVGFGIPFVLEEVVKNAVMYGEGEILLKTGYDSATNSVVVTVENGGTLDASIEEIFEWYRSVSGEGEGFGLALSKLTLDMLGGSISIGQAQGLEGKNVVRVVISIPVIADRASLSDFDLTQVVNFSGNLDQVRIIQDVTRQLFSDLSSFVYLTDLLGSPAKNARASMNELKRHYAENYQGNKDPNSPRVDEFGIFAEWDKQVLLLSYLLYGEFLTEDGLVERLQEFKEEDKVAIGLISSMTATLGDTILQKGETTLMEALKKYRQYALIVRQSIAEEFPDQEVEPANTSDDIGYMKRVFNLFLGNVTDVDRASMANVEEAMRTIENLWKTENKAWVRRVTPERIGQWLRKAEKDKVDVESLYKRLILKSTVSAQIINMKFVDAVIALDTAIQKVQVESGQNVLNNVLSQLAKIYKEQIEPNVALTVEEQELVRQLSDWQEGDMVVDKDGNSGKVTGTPTVNGEQIVVVNFGRAKRRHGGILGFEQAALELKRVGRKTASGIEAMSLEDFSKDNLEVLSSQVKEFAKQSAAYFSRETVNEVTAQKYIDIGLGVVELLNKIYENSGKNKKNTDLYIDGLLAIIFSMPMDADIAGKLSPDRSPGVQADLYISHLFYNQQYVEELSFTEVFDFESMLKEKMMGYKRSLKTKATINRLNNKVPVLVVEPFHELGEVYDFQDQFGAMELGISVVTGENSLIAVYQGDEDFQPSALSFFDDLTGHVHGHTHHFTTPIRESTADDKISKELLKKKNKPSFILAFDRSSRRIEIAYLTTASVAWQYERDDQEKVKEILSELGVLSVDRASLQEQRENLDVVYDPDNPELKVIGLIGDRATLSGEVFILQPQTEFKGLDDAEPLIKESLEVFDPRKYNQAGRRGVPIGKSFDKDTLINNDAPGDVTHLPIKIPGSEVVVPVEFESLRSVIQDMINHSRANDPNYDNNFMYLTILKSELQAGEAQIVAGKVPRVHADGLQRTTPDQYTRPDYIYLISASDGGENLGTIGFMHPFDVESIIRDFDLRGVLQDKRDFTRAMTEQANKAESYELEEGEIYLLNAYNAHVAKQASRQAKRTNVRIRVGATNFLGRTDITPNPYFERILAESKPDVSRTDSGASASSTEYDDDKAMLPDDDVLKEDVEESIQTPEAGLDTGRSAVRRYLYNLGIRKFSRIDKYGKLYELSISRNLAPTVEYLKSLGVERIADVVAKEPDILARSLNEKIIPVVDKLKEFGITNIGPLLESFPTIVGLDMEGNIVPKLELLRNVEPAYHSLPVNVLQRFFMMNLNILELIRSIAAEQGYELMGLTDLLKTYSTLEKRIRTTKKEGLVAWTKSGQTPQETEQIQQQLKAEIVSIVRKKNDDVDRAVLDANDEKIENVGGIDFNPAKFNLEVEGEGLGVPINLPDSVLEGIDSNIEGFYPVIFNIVPVTNIPLILGSSESGSPIESTRSASSEKELELSMR